MQRYATEQKIPLHGSGSKVLLSMTHPIKADIIPVFNYKNKSLSPSESAPVHIKIYRQGINGQKPLRRIIPTGIEVKEFEWESSTGKVNLKNPNAHHINKVLRDFISGIEDFEYRLINSGQLLTDENLNEYLKGLATGQDSFTSFFRNEIDPALKRGTRKEHHYTYNLLCEFRPNILFADITLSLIQEFDRYLRNKGLAINTIYKHHQHVNRFLRLAGIKGVFTDSKNPYRHFKLRKTQGNRVNLTPEELKRIEQLQIIDAYPELKLVHDLFLFSCYTGLRYSDIATLTLEHIIQTPDGPCVVKTMEKVPKPVTLPISLLFGGKPLQIVEPYLKRAAAGKSIFKTPSNQHVNRQLKVLAVMAQIQMRLTFHVARHTFGTLLAELTQNPYLIMDLMGHADIQTSMIYIHRSQERINRQLRNVQWNLF